MTGAKEADAVRVEALSRHNRYRCKTWTCERARGVADGPNAGCASTRAWRHRRAVAAQLAGWRVALADGALAVQHTRADWRLTWSS